MVQMIATGTVPHRIVAHEPTLSIATPYTTGPSAEPIVVAVAKMLLRVAIQSVP